MKHYIDSITCDSAFVCNEKAIFDAVTILNFERQRSSGIERSDYIASNVWAKNVVRCPE